jgi:ATP-dependent helicase/nuclease subunit B
MATLTSRTKPSVFTIKAGLAFARVLARGVVERVGPDPLALSDVTIFVPTRRAMRTLREQFTYVLEGASLGPRIHALGDLDDEEIAFDLYTDDINLAPAIAPLKRRLELANLVHHWHEARGNALPFAQALAHAGELGRFLDEVTEQNADLEELQNLAPESLAAHWQEVTDFLQIIAQTWPQYLEDNGFLEPTARRDALIRRQAKSLVNNPPNGWVIAAGSTGSIPATRDLLKTIANLSLGAVVLPALDCDLDAESWKVLEPGHPQFGLHELLAHFGVDRDEVQPWTDAEAHEPRTPQSRFLSEALRPPPTTDAWRDLIEKDKHAFGEALAGINLIEAANPQEEALAIAIAMREALESPKKTAALVTPDRGLARRVAIELSRWDIAIDDSAGTPLARTPPGTFLTLLARTCAEGLSPVSLLGLLKHPLTAGGMEPAKFRRLVREMELLALRGLRPEPALEGIANALARKDASEELQKWFADLHKILLPFLESSNAQKITLREIVAAHALAAERLASTSEQRGEEILWRGAAGEAASALVTELLEHGADCILRSGDQYADVFRDLAEARVVRPRFGLHPRLSLLGPLEARLQHFDLVILGGLNEGVWPAQTTTDPWLSRPMRKQLGLESPERKTGLAAHDFATLTASANVLLTRSLKTDGTPTTPSRWLLRLRQLAKGLGIDEKLQGRRDLLDWARNIDHSKRQKRAPRPEPRPPVSVRPRKLSVTQIETWLRDPYAIYARHILHLIPLEDIDAEPGPRERGIAIHAALERFLKAFPDRFPDDALEQLKRFGDDAFAQAGASDAAKALWQPRFDRAALWFINYETERRRNAERALSEIKGALALPAQGGTFTLTGRVDRIEFFPDGAAAIIDYKTGRSPSQKQVETLLSPQLPLEGAMLMRGGFPDIRTSQLAEFVHVELSGAQPAGRELAYTKDATAKSEEAYLRLQQRVSIYDEQAQPYRSREMMERLSDISDYDHLARVREWTLIGEGGE